MRTEVKTETKNDYKETTNQKQHVNENIVRVNKTH